MEVMLLEKIRGLGSLGDRVKVAAGYARNYLIPQKKAEPATKANIEAFEKSFKEYEAKEQSRLDEAKAKASTFENATLYFKVRTSEGGKLFGSIIARDVINALAEKGVEVAKSSVLNLPAIKEVGEYPILVHLHSDVDVPVTIKVEAIEANE